MRVTCEHTVQRPPPEAAWVSLIPTAKLSPQLQAVMTVFWPSTHSLGRRAYRLLPLVQMQAAAGIRSETRQEWAGNLQRLRVKCKAASDNGQVGTPKKPVQRWQQRRQLGREGDRTCA